jgi:hypothetical protein
VGAQQGLGLVGLWITNDDGLAAAELETGHGRLVGHALGKPQHVDQGFLGAPVGPHPRPAQGGTERRVVDGDNRFQPRRLVVAEDDLLVAVVLHEVEDVHRRSSCGFRVDDGRGPRPLLGDEG